MQRAPDRIRADLGQPVIGLPQGSLQQAQGPRRRAVLVALGRAGPFGQNALLRISAIADPRATSVAGSHGREPVAVEATDPGRDGLGVPSSDLVGRHRIARAIRNGQEGSSALDLRGGRAERAAQAGQLLAFIRRERTQGICLVARHGTPRSTRIIPSLYQTSQQMTHYSVGIVTSRWPCWPMPIWPLCVSTPSGGEDLDLAADLLPLTVPEVRRLLWRLVWARPPDPGRILAWSNWRRRHQQRARRSHWTRRTRTHQPRLSY